MTTRSLCAATVLVLAGCTVLTSALAAQVPTHFSGSEWTSFGMPAQKRDREGGPTLPAFLIEASFGAGNFKHDTSGSPLDGDTDAALFRFRFEGYGSSGFGGGFEIESIATDDDLFAASGFGNSEASSGEIFGYGAYRMHHDRFTMPVRFGLFGRRYEIEEQTSNANLEITSFGIKVQAEPDWAFIARENLRFSMFANIALGVGGSEIETNAVSTKWDTTIATFGLDVGLRLRLSPATLSLSYLYRHDAIDESDVSNATRVSAMDTDFHGVAFSVGFVF